MTLTIGTGIESGVILGGIIFCGANGIAGELGHSVIKLGGSTVGNSDLRIQNYFINPSTASSILG